LLGERHRKKQIYIYIYIWWEGGVGKRSQKVMQAILGREGGGPLKQLQLELLREKLQARGSRLEARGLRLGG
jgi:hypothetical protein